MRMTVILDGVLLSDEQLQRLPVLSEMAGEIYESSIEKCVKVCVPYGMSGESIIEYASCKDPTDFALSPFGEKADITRRTLDWCGVEIHNVKTPREIRKQLELIQLENFTLATTVTNMIDAANRAQQLLLVQHHEMLQLFEQYDNE
jgi:hypothetical protein